MTKSTDFADRPKFYVQSLCNPDDKGYVTVVTLQLLEQNIAW